MLKIGKLSKNSPKLFPYEKEKTEHTKGRHYGNTAS